MLKTALKTPDFSGASKQDTVVVVCCSNCGHPSERHHLESQHLVRTQCSHCDYLLITCSLTHRVIESYAPGLYGAPA